jgi:hypothetical protein
MQSSEIDPYLRSCRYLEESYVFKNKYKINVKSVILKKISTSEFESVGHENKPNLKTGNSGRTHEAHYPLAGFCSYKLCVDVLLR